MSLQPYQFEPNSGQLTQLADGQFVAIFELSYFEGQTLNYEVEALNAQNLREIIVKVEGNETGMLKYHEGQTTAFTKLPNEVGVELAAEKDGKRKDSIAVTFS